MSLALHRVTKDYRITGRPPHRAVHDVSLRFEQGRLHTLLGPSGCGKTTLLRLIAGFEHPTAGTIEYDGRTLNDVPPYRRGFPMVFQSYALFPHMSVLDNVCYGLSVRGLPRAQRVERAQRILSLLGLDQFLHRRPAQLSGGQQQRVALARALILEPPLILLDEPLSNLDAALRLSMRAEIRALQQRLAITALYVTHDQEEALAISDSIVVMHDGAIQQVGSPLDLHLRPANEFVARFMGCPNIRPIRPAPDGTISLLGVPVAAPRDARHVMIRSDALRFAPLDDTRPAATILDATFLGSRIQYRLLLDDATHLTVDRAFPDAGDPLDRGTRTGLLLLPERLHFL